MQTIPKLNMNGTSKESLIADYREAITALAVAYEALAKCAPHERDYQTYENPGDSLEAARKEHLFRLNAIFEAHEEWLSIAIRVQDQ